MPATRERFTVPGMHARASTQITASTILLATLVYAGSRLKLADVMTVDHDDFETYRMAGRRKFRILPERGRAK